MTTKLLLIITFIFLTSCASEKRAGSVDIPIDNTPMKLIYNEDFFDLTKTSEYSFEDQVYKKEAKDLVIYYVFSDKLKKDIKILAYDNPSISADDVITIPISDESNISCRSNQNVDNFKGQIENFIRIYSKEGKIFLNKDEQKKDSFYQEHILFKPNGRVHYFGILLHRFLEVNNPLIKSLACTSLGHGNRNTFISLTNELKRQIEKE